MRIALIPARGGSRRVPRKNVRQFMGKPMLTYPLDAAKASGLFDLIVVSTDDAEIAALAFQHGATVVPREADDGSTGTQEIAARVLDQMQVHGSVACVIYPTSPLLTPQLLSEGYERLLKPDAKPFCMSVREWKVATGTCWEDAGCYYWGWIRAFRDRKPLDDFNTSRVALPDERVCDINTWEDWNRAEAMFKALGGAA